MPFFKGLAGVGLAVLAVASLAVAEGAWAGPTAAGAAAAPKAQRPPVAAKDKKPTGQAAEGAPIVMGRSVAVVRKSKLHHIKAKPDHPGASAKD